MRAIKRINNNSAICEDEAGHQLIALGRGVGFGTMPRDISLKDINRTFYGIDPKYLSFIDEVDPEMLEFAAQFSEVVRQQVSYDLSPNLPITLADHFQFMLKRAREHIVVSLPVSADVQQSRPVEYRLGELAVRGLRRAFNVHIPAEEAAGIALSIVNAMVSPSNRTARATERNRRALDLITKTIERTFHVHVDRSSFAYARFTTHMRYLFKRLENDAQLDTNEVSGVGLYDLVIDEYPTAVLCARDIDDQLEAIWGKRLTRNELLYVIMHINRIASEPARATPKSSEEAVSHGKAKL